MEIKMTLIPGGKSGKVGKISVKPGDKVDSGDILAQVETGKGNRPIKATEAGTITMVMCEEGSEVVSNQPMFKLEKESNRKDEEVLIPEEDNSVKSKDIIYLDTELLIIGAGPGGYVAAIYAAKKGLKVTLVEKDELGGTCLNVGCIPTKALVKSAEVCHNVMEAKLFGIDTTKDFQIDMKQVIRRKDEVKNKLVLGIYALLEANKIKLIDGQGTFLSKDEVAVYGKQNYRIRFRDVIIATGSKISKLNLPGIDLPFVMNSTEALSCTELPKSITIVGGGVIGMEFAFIYKNLGVEVHVVEFMDRLLTMVDREVSYDIKELSKKAGIKIYTNAKVMKIEQATGGQAVVTYKDQDGEHLIISNKVLVAVGREPNLDGLDIEKSGVKLNERGRGISVNKQMRSDIEHIYAIGDVTNIIQLAHVASHQGIIAVENILGNFKEIMYSAVPNVIFTSPEIASVGLSEEDCKEKAMDYSVSKTYFEYNGKAITMNQTEGFIKLIKNNSTGRIVGGSIIGPDASTLISTLTLGINIGIGDEELTQTIFAHPTTAEVIHEAAFGFGIGALHQV